MVRVFRISSVETYLVLFLWQLNNFICTIHLRCSQFLPNNCGKRATSPSFCFPIKLEIFFCLWLLSSSIFVSMTRELDLVGPRWRAGRDFELYPLRKHFVIQICNLLLIRKWNFISCVNFVLIKLIWHSKAYPKFKLQHSDGFRRRDLHSEKENLLCHIFSIFWASSTSCCWLPFSSPRLCRPFVPLLFLSSLYDIALDQLEHDIKVAKRKKEK